MNEQSEATTRTITHQLELIQALKKAAPPERGDPNKMQAAVPIVQDAPPS